MPTTLPESIRSLAARTGILERGSRVVVAVSGGQDSCALLHALAALRTDLDLTLHAAHLEHGFRGEESVADAAFVRELADTLDLPSTIESRDVPGIAARLHLSSQEGARRARHEFLEQVADSVGAVAIALGHTRDDRVETVLMNILRGTGVDGLAGLTPRKDRRIRPLLAVSRAETAAYCVEHGIAFRTDASNESARYTRGRVRHELLPNLEASYNPGVREAILRLAKLAEQDSAALNAIASDELRQWTLNRTDRSVVLSVEGVRKLRPAIQSRLIRGAFSLIRGSLHDVEASAVERVMNAVNAGNAVNGVNEGNAVNEGNGVNAVNAVNEGNGGNEVNGGNPMTGSGRPRFQFTLPHGDILVEVTGTELRVANVEQTPQARRIQYELDIPGRVEIPEFGRVFAAGFSDGAGESLRGSRIRLDAAQVAPPITIRNRRPGDRLRPRGLGGSKKVQDILTDAKVPVGDRDAVPVVCDARGILWLVGHSIDERCAREADSRLDPGSCLVIEVVERIGPRTAYNPMAD